MWEFNLVGCCIGLFGIALLATVVAYAAAVLAGRADDVMNSKE